MGRRAGGHGDWSTKAYKRDMAKAIRNPNGIKFRSHGKVNMAKIFAEERKSSKSSAPAARPPKTKWIWVDGVGFKEFQVKE